VTFHVQTTECPDDIVLVLSNCDLYLNVVYFSVMQLNQNLAAAGKETQFDYRSFALYDMRGNQLDLDIACQQTGTARVVMKRI